MGQELGVEMFFFFFFFFFFCVCVCLTQISLTPIATLYDNGFSGRVQNSSRAFNYPWPCGESQVNAASALRHDVATSIAKA